MIDELIKVFNSKPRKIDEVLWNDPVLTLIGNDWTFNTVSSWRCFEGPQLIGGYDSKNANETLSTFNGQETTMGVGESGIDPEFRTIKSMVLQILVTNWFEPWIYRDGDVTLVESAFI